MTISRRDEIVQLVAKKKTLIQKKSNVFLLTHEADTERREYWVSAPYSVNVFNVLVAYIQFKCSDIEQVYGMDQEDVIQVLVELYSCKQIEEPKRRTYYEVDLYNNWEYFCSAYNDVCSIELLKHNGLDNVLKEFVEDFYKQQPGWRSEAN